MCPTFSSSPGVSRQYVFLIALRSVPSSGTTAQPQLVRRHFDRVRARHHAVEPLETLSARQVTLPASGGVSQALDCAHPALLPPDPNTPLHLGARVNASARIDRCKCVFGMNTFEELYVEELRDWRETLEHVTARVEAMEQLAEDAIERLGKEEVDDE